MLVAEVLEGKGGGDGEEGRVKCPRLAENAPEVQATAAPVPLSTAIESPCPFFITSVIP